MAKASARGPGAGRVGQVRGRSQVKDPKTGMWTRRDTSTGRFQSVVNAPKGDWTPRDPTSGQFAASKAKGGPFLGVKREGKRELFIVRLWRWLF